MLSRIAESLFWIGRYVERAEDTCRILDVHLQRSVEDPTVDPALTAESLFTAMGLDGEVPVDDRGVLSRLCYSPDWDSSIVSALAGAREAARRARETVSVEMWEGINTTYHEVTSGSFPRLRPLLAFRMVRERCAVISGLADQTMIHDEGWQFLQLGRSIERVDMTSRLISMAAVTVDSSIAWNNVLRGCGAHHAFIRAYGGDPLPRDAAGFLLLDRMFPRSVWSSLTSALDALEALSPGAVRVSITNKAALLLGQARAELEYRAPDDLLVDIAERMVALQEVCAEASDAVRTEYFEGSNARHWHQGGMA